MIVVTGMHRSGTSLAALVLQALGLDFGPPEHLYAADDWNVNGYLERTDVVDLNSRLLTGFERTTGRRNQLLSQANYLRMPGAASIVSRADELSHELSRVGVDLNGLAVKDPRFCVTLDAWHRHQAIAGLVVALRHPSAAVASLRRRNKLPPIVGHRFWRWHMEAVLPHIDRNTLVIRQDFLTGPDRASELGRIRRWMREIAGLEPSLDVIDVIDSSLVHHTPSDDGVPIESLRMWDSLTSAQAWSPRPR
ncbi:MAG: hypothetical protein ACR2P0_17445 [Acidimicrobiales bacterium]